jgi:uncharacterized membrane protein
MGIASRQPDPLRHVADAMQERLDALPPTLAHRRIFLDTYRRTTLAVGDALRDGLFEDPEWVVAWDAAFADLYLSSHDADVAGGVVRRPWRLAFAADPGLPALRHVLLGINAHVNYDLPQALLAVISDDDFGRPEVMAARHRDHERIDGVLSGRVSAEDDELSSGGRRLVDRILEPANRAASRRFLREARQKVWLNTEELQRARAARESSYAARLAELELLSAAKIADLLAPGQVLLRLAVAGFGVTLPPPA